MFAQAAIAQTVLRALAVSLPRLGLVRETYELVKVAHAMEQAHKIVGRGVTEFNFLFQAAFQSVVDRSDADELNWLMASGQPAYVALIRLTGS